MTAQLHEHPIHDAEHRPDVRTPLDDGPTRPTRPRWLLPGLAAALGVAALVGAGVISLSTVLYAGLFGGMLLMHAGGHGGHGGHGGPGGQATHQGHGGGTTPGDEDLSHRSYRSQLGGSRSDGALEDRAATNPTGDEQHDHDQPSSHGCH